MKLQLRANLLVLLLLLFVVACGTDDAATPTTELVPPTTDATPEAEEEDVPETTEPEADDTETPEAETDTGELVPLTVLLNWTWYASDHSYFQVGLDMGFYEEEGLDVTFMEGTGSGDTLRLVGNQNADLGYVDAGSMMFGIAEDIPVRAICVVNQESPMGVVFPAELGWSDFEDLAGATVALTQGDVFQSIFPAVLAAVGMEDEVEIVATASPAAKEAAVLTGNADALLAFYTEQAPRMTATQDVEMDWLSFADAGVNTFNMSIFSNTSWLEENADSAAAFVRATQKAIDYTVENPEEAAAIFAAAHSDNFTEELSLHQIEASVPLLHTDRSEGQPYCWTAEEDWAQTEEILSTFSDLAPQDDLATYYTNEFVDQ